MDANLKCVFCGKAFLQNTPTKTIRATMLHIASVHSERLAAGLNSLMAVEPECLYCGKVLPKDDPTKTIRATMLHMAAVHPERLAADLERMLGDVELRSSGARAPAPVKPRKGPGKPVAAADRPPEVKPAAPVPEIEKGALGEFADGLRDALEYGPFGIFKK